MALPAIVRLLVSSMVRRRVRDLLWKQAVLRHSHEEIVESALRDWRVVLTVMSDGPFFFGGEPSGIDAVVFGALATSLLTLIDTPIRDFLRARRVLAAYADRMLGRFFPEFAVNARSFSPDPGPR
jgi:glutathione S-transferase